MIKLLVILIIGIPVALLRGLVLSNIINWFTPFHISVIQAIGLTFIVALFTHNLKTNNERKEGESWHQHAFNALLTSVLVSLMVWGLAYLWSLFL